MYRLGTSSGYDVTGHCSEQRRYQQRYLLREARARMSQRTGVLELAVLGLLHENPMHGYELRKRLNSVLGAFRAFGYGSLYPCLKDLLRQGLIAEEAPAGPTDKPLAGCRSKIVYRLDPPGEE